MRARLVFPLVLLGLTALPACSSDAEGAAPPAARASLSGDAIPFADPPDGRIAGATISVLEQPELGLVTAADGHFEFADLAVGGEYTLLLDHPDYVPIQTGTITLGEAGASRVTFQAVTPTMHGLLAGMVQITPDETRCQMVTTITRVGKSMYDEGAHGEAGATVTLDPPLPAEHGPIYFNASVIPQLDLTESSDDGGVLFVNVPPGEYTWTAHKAGATFSPVKMKCRAGLLVNASPPWGLQRVE